MDNSKREMTFIEEAPTVEEEIYMFLEKYYKGLTEEQTRNEQPLEINLLQGALRTIRKGIKEVSKREG